MYYTLIITILILAIYFKKKSRSDFFKQDEIALKVYRDIIERLLIIKERSVQDIALYLRAYDFFCKFTAKFDGATFVKDLCDIPKLDLDAMVHDFECLIGANRNYIKWFKAVWRYYENMRKNGKGNQIIRAIGLCFIGLFFVPYCALLTPKYQE